MSQDLKRRLAEYALAAEEYRLARGHRLALDAVVDLAKSAGHARPLQALQQLGSLGVLAIAQGLRAVNIRTLKHYLSTLPPEPPPAPDVNVWHAEGTTWVN